MRPIPTTQELYNNIKNDLISRLNLITTTLKKVLNAFAGVFAAQFRLAYNFLSDIQRNLFPDTADSESVGGTLERQGRIWLGRNPFPATPGVFTLSVTGQAGAVLRQGLTFKSNDDSLNPGQMYVLDAEYILSGTDDLIEVRSLGGGSQFNLNVSDNLTITEPVISVNQTVSVFAVLEQPTDAEDLEVYRQAVLNSRQLEPQGGSKTDYRLWAQDANGVRRVYPYVRNGAPGNVDIYVEANASDSTDGNGTPGTPILEDVEEVVQFDPDETKPEYERGRAPIQAIITALPVTTVPVDVTITGLSIDTTAIRDAIESSMENFIFTVRPFVAGGELLRNKNDVLFSARLQSSVTDVLSGGNFFSDFTMEVNGNVVSSYLFDLGNIPYLRNVTYN